MESRSLRRSAFAAAIALACAAPALAHHGFGLFQMDKNTDWSGTLTKLELVNPHSYLYFDTVGADGKPLSMRCEMRAAMLIMRSLEDGSVPAGQACRGARPSRAVEQAVLTIPPSGGNGSLVPRSVREDFAGKITLDEIRARGRACRLPSDRSFALKREYTAEDPEYPAAPYKGSDVVLLSETPFEKHPCAELTYEFSKGGG